MNSGQYLTYNEYIGLGGTLEQTPFNLLEFEARKIIDTETQNRLVNLETQIEEVKRCVFALINELKNQENEKNISSESVGSYSVSYNNATSQDKMRNIHTIVFTYLVNCITPDGVPYLYRGV